MSSYKYVYIKLLLNKNETIIQSAKKEKTVCNHSIVESNATITIVHGVVECSKIKEKKCLEDIIFRTRTGY